MPIQKQESLQKNIRFYGLWDENTNTGTKKSAIVILDVFD